MNKKQWDPTGSWPPRKVLDLRKVIAQQDAEDWAEGERILAQATTAEHARRAMAFVPGMAGSPEWTRLEALVAQAKGETV